ncbi:MAG TPA: glycosyltransferase [Actinomycetes bacterium]|jgi:GT2 family glycosyltransferase|nr:glycosyltransferase [Actinomycetes bacterium]
MPPSAPNVAVVVATRNRVQELLSTLSALQRLPERPRVVVVDNDSGDETVSWVRKQHAAVDLVELDRNLGAAARTVGARHVSEPYVAFSDDDSWWASGSLARAVELFERHPRLAVVAARVLVGPGERLDPVCAAMAASPLPAAADLPGPSVLGFVACGAVVRRCAFLAVRGFHPRFGVGGEEELLAMDLAARGWGLAYVEEVMAHHHPSPSRDPDGRRRVQVRNGLWSAWLRRPLGGVARQTLSLLPAAVGDPAARAGVLDAVRGLPWVLRERRPVAPELEADLRTLGTYGTGSGRRRTGRR